ncbi:MAG: hypothetical protein MSIBF_05485 [Candidatus Altiarchaeales archaeon IMC4]|nr:MAG: hypothetical protein MSIBF_05485 [Candidatus Altiarchaeales archaeon IMC4]
MFKRVIVGGTFDVLHKGHERVMGCAFSIGQSVTIGLSTDEFANRFRAKTVMGYEKRKSAVEGFAKTFKKEYRIVPIDDSYGISTTDPEAGCIVVSEETLLRAEEINMIRFKKGLEKMVIIVVPLVLADDGRPISGGRIHSGEITPDGKRV